MRIEQHKKKRCLQSSVDAWFRVMNLEVEEDCLIMQVNSIIMK